MKTLHSALLLIIAGGLSATGCRTLPVVPHAMKCDVRAELLAGKCMPPTQIANDSTYAGLVDAMQADRKALRECGVTADSLRDVIERCNQSTDEYNKKIDAVNAAR